MAPAFLVPRCRFPKASSIFRHILRFSHVATGSKHGIVGARKYTCQEEWVYWWYDGQHLRLPQIIPGSNPGILYTIIWRPRAYRKGKILKGRKLDFGTLLNICTENRYADWANITSKCSCLFQRQLRMDSISHWPS